ncbi:hypothetical protein [Spartinivicinus poritis]|uniref:Uncharacterized protein n=1 Tax=Spartinivicinus poritis TaxID=2994640 RepID=A0ABT5UFC5_9GAMM|nr:hypothetical protein [Spartinivicinus sp. A2-2]MDE1465085.1 hypothetical protein [Spartinivicinus sp. A2-2]
MATRRKNTSTETTTEDKPEPAERFFEVVFKNASISPLECTLSKKRIWIAGHANTAPDIFSESEVIHLREILKGFPAITMRIDEVA